MKRKEVQKAPETVKPMERWAPVILVLATAALLIAGLRVPESVSGFHRTGFAELPALNGGRIKPIDTVARTSLLLLSGKQQTNARGRSVPAIEWLMDVMFRPAVALGPGRRPSSFPFSVEARTTASRGGPMRVWQPSCPAGSHGPSWSSLVAVDARCTRCAPMGRSQCGAKSSIGVVDAHGRHCGRCPGRDAAQRSWRSPCSSQTAARDRMNPPSV